MATDKVNNLDLTNGKVSKHTLREGLAAMAIIEDALEWLKANIPEEILENSYDYMSRRLTVDKLLSDYGFVTKQRALLHQALGETVETRASVFADLLKERTK